MLALRRGAGSGKPGPAPRRAFSEGLPPSQTALGEQERLRRSAALQRTGAAAAPLPRQASLTSRSPGPAPGSPARSKRIPRAPGRRRQPRLHLEDDLLSDRDRAGLCPRGFDTCWARVQETATTPPRAPCYDTRRWRQQACRSPVGSSPSLALKRTWLPGVPRT